MKRKLLSIMVLVVAGLAFTAMAQRETQDQSQGTRNRLGAMSAEQRAQMRERWQNMSEEERAQFREQMRQRFQNMSEEQRAQMRGRFGAARLSREDQLKALAAIEEQVAKLKAAINAAPAANDQQRQNYRDMTEEQRTKMREEMTKRREARMTALTAIQTEVDKLRGPRREQLEIAELTRIQTLAKQEKATQTSNALQGLITRMTARQQAGDTGRPSPEAQRRRGARQRDAQGDAATQGGGAGNR